MNCLIVNGEVLKVSEFVPFRSENSVLLTREIWFGHGGIPLLGANLAAIAQQLALLQLPVPSLINNEKEFFRITKRLLNRLKYFRSGIVKLDVFAELPETNFIVTASATDIFEFPISKQGIVLGFADQQKFSKNMNSKYAFCNLPLWKITSAGIKNTPVKNVAFFNEKGFLTDCIGANIFGLKKDEIFTPAAETGCYIDTIRDSVITAAKSMSLRINETDKLSKEILLQMDEIFLASESGGIEWVMGIGNKRFVHPLTDLLQKQLNENLKQLVT